MKSGMAFRGKSGTALLLALLVVMASVFVLAGWATMLAARTVFSEQFATGQKRRLAYENAKNIGKQWGLNAYNEAMVPTASINLGNGWGQFTAATIISNPITVGVGTTGGILNPFGPMGTGGFQTNISTTLSGDGFTNARRYYFRSRSPVSGGFPLVAHYTTNGVTPTFAGAAVATNGYALMFTNSASITNSPSAPSYQSSTNRLVRISQASTVNAPLLSFPWQPLSSGTNTFDGSLPAQLSRTYTIQNLASEIELAYSTNSPTVSDPARSPNGSTGNFRILGTPPGGREVIEASFSRSPPILAVGPAPDQAPQQVNNQRIRFYYFGVTLDVRFTSSGVQYLKDGSWEPTPRIDPLATYIRVDSTGDIDHFDRTDLTAAIVLSDVGGGGTDRAILFAPYDTELVAVRSNEVSFSTNTGAYATGVDAALVYKPATFPESSLLILGTPMNTTAYNAQVALSPATFQLRALVDGFPVIQLDSAATSTFTNPADSTAVLDYEPSGAQLLRLRAGAIGNSPFLMHVQQEVLPGANPAMEWRKVLMVLDAQNTLNIQTSTSALTFSYIDSNAFQMALEDADSQRRTAVSIAGRAGASTTDSQIVGGAGRTWSAFFTFNESAATFLPGGTLTLSGGVRSNRGVEVSPSSSLLQLTPDAAPGGLELFLDRIGWIESWQQ